jgi:hypothetical protein
MRRPRAGDERSSQALGRRRGSAWWPIRAACQELADEEYRQQVCRKHLTLNGYSQGAGGRQEGPANPRRENGKRGPAQEFRFRHYDERKKTTANEPEQRKPVRVARREALPHFREEMRILNRRRQRPLARHPLASGGDKKTGLPGASTKNTGDGAWLFEK